MTKTRTEALTRRTILDMFQATLERAERKREAERAEIQDLKADLERRAEMRSKTMKHFGMPSPTEYSR